MQPSSHSIEFTAAERRELAFRERETQRVLARLAATATLEDQEKLADELCPKHDAWIQGRNRVQASRKVAPAATRPTRPGRTTVKRRARAARTATPSRGDPDDGDPEPPPLADHHRQLLEASAISDAVAAERGYWTATRKSQLETLGFKRFQCIVPALVVPIRDARGGIVNYQIRPDQPRIGENGKPVKYESPAGIPPTLDVPPRAAAALASPHSPLWITEGARKADAGASAGLCCVSLPGVWSWAKRLNGDARQVLPDLQRVRLEDRKVIVAFDSDAMVKSQVHKALDTYLVSQGALVSFCYLPELEPGVKCGLDDFLAVHSVEEAWEYVEAELRPPPEPKPQRPALPSTMLLAAVEKLLRRYVRFPEIVVVSAVGGSLSAQLALLRHEARRLALTLIDASQQTEEDR